MGTYFVPINLSKNFVPMKKESRKYKPLTETEIREYKPQAKPYKMGDGGGLYVMVYLCPFL